MRGSRRDVRSPSERGAFRFVDPLSDARCEQEATREIAEGRRNHQEREKDTGDELAEETKARSEGLEAATIQAICERRILRGEFRG